MEAVNSILGQSTAPTRSFDQLPPVSGNLELQHDDSLLSDIKLGANAVFILRGYSVFVLSCIASCIMLHFLNWFSIQNPQSPVVLKVGGTTPLLVLSRIRGAVAASSKIWGC